MARGLVAPAFGLLRYYAVASFILIGTATAAIGLGYRHLAMEDFMRMGEHLNQDLATVFANLVWDEHSRFIGRADMLPAPDLMFGPEARKLDAAVRRMMRGHGLVRVKIYAPSGLTVYSSEAIQIGEQQGENPGFRAAMAGKVVSDLVYRDSINAFDRRYESLNLISSYVPLRASPEQPVSGVLELYEDVTPHLERLRAAQARAVVGVVIVLIMLYAALLLVVHRAQALTETRAAHGAGQGGPLSL